MRRWLQLTLACLPALVIGACKKSSPAAERLIPVATAASVAPIAGPEIRTAPSLPPVLVIPPVPGVNCVEPGDADLELMKRAQAGIAKGGGRFPLDKEGCLFMRVSTDAGVTREAMEARHGGVWRVTYERLDRADSTVESADGDHDGAWNSVTTTWSGDAGWRSELLDFEADGGAKYRHRTTQLDAIMMRVVREAWERGAWVVFEDFETSIIQR
jgi:hypothetical protein